MCVTHVHRHASPVGCQGVLSYRLCKQCSTALRRGGMRVTEGAGTGCEARGNRATGAGCSWAVLQLTPVPKQKAKGEQKGGICRWGWSAGQEPSEREFNNFGLAGRPSQPKRPPHCASVQGPQGRHGSIKRCNRGAAAAQSSGAGYRAKTASTTCRYRPATGRRSASTPHTGLVHARSFGDRFGASTAAGPVAALRSKLPLEALTVRPQCCSALPTQQLPRARWSCAPPGST